MLISSADLLGTAALQASHAGRAIASIREANPAHTTLALAEVEKELTQALAELRAAQWGIARKLPQFDSQDLDLILDAETYAIGAARKYIPAAEAIS